MDASQFISPILKDLTAENITENVNATNSACPNRRLKFVLERLVQHLHAFARETQLETDEWMQGLNFLVDVGKISTEIRNEFAFLSDVLGLSLLVDSINHPKPPQSTEGSLLGPYHSPHAKNETNGSVLVEDAAGEPCIVVCDIVNRAGQPLEGVKIDIWSTDSLGFYGTQKTNHKGPEQSAVMYSDKDGKFWFRSIVPAPYPVPIDGPVGLLLHLLNRHCYRPSHMHFMFEKQGYDHLITALYRRGDPYETSDVVFGVKDSLVVDYLDMNADQLTDYSVTPGTKILQHKFVLVSDEETRSLRSRNALKAMKILGFDVKLCNGLPIPDVD